MITHTDEYWEGYNAAIADVMEGARGKSPDAQRDITDITSGLLSRESEERRFGMDKLFPFTMPNLDIPKLDFLGSASITEEWSRTEISRSTIRQTSTTGALTPEDRILNAMAGLLEDAKGGSPSHAEAMAKAAEGITRSVKDIKEIREKSRHRYTPLKEEPALIPPATPHVPLPQTGRAVVSDKSPEQVERELQRIKDFVASLTGAEKAGFQNALHGTAGPGGILTAIIGLTSEKLTSALGLLTSTSPQAPAHAGHEQTGTVTPPVNIPIQKPLTVIHAH